MFNVNDECKMWIKFSEKQNNQIYLKQYEWDTLIFCITCFEKLWWDICTSILYY